LLAFAVQRKTETVWRREMAAMNRKPETLTVPISIWNNDITKRTSCYRWIPLHQIIFCSLIMWRNFLKIS
jgi:hypothetical protein